MNENRYIVFMFTIIIHNENTYVNIWFTFADIQTLTKVNT